MVINGFPTPFVPKRGFCDQAPCKAGQSSFLHQGSEMEGACFALCSKNKLCDYITSHGDSK